MSIVTTKYKSFIETQFPVTLLSYEAYKERKAGSGQTLTGLGKWWGRKPLVLVRATVLGLLLPASQDLKADQDCFLALMTMDDEGLLLRKHKPMTAKQVVAAMPNAPVQDGKWLKSATAAERQTWEQQAFLSLPYNERLEHCKRPEEIEGPSSAAWTRINAHLGTTADSIPTLVKELGLRQFGKVPAVGDAFCGGGSIPFEAARMGCEAFGNDLNPVAALLTWGALNIVGGGSDQAAQLHEEQVALLAAVDKQITSWGIEHDERGRRADAYLYWTETKCPTCEWMVPVVPSFIISEKSATVAKILPNTAAKNFSIEIIRGVDATAKAVAKKGTVASARLTCPHCGESHKIEDLRGDRTVETTTRIDGQLKTLKEKEWGLRRWENFEVVPRAQDVFQERLYCIRWVEVTTTESGAEVTLRLYEAPTAADLLREKKALALLEQHFEAWQAAGFIPSAPITLGVETSRLLRERGWTHWHQLFNPRQLLVQGLVSSKISGTAAGLLGVGLSSNKNSRLVFWDAASEKVCTVFTNQALNTYYTYGCRGFTAYVPNVVPQESPTCHVGTVSLGDARKIVSPMSFWITDPPYADAVSYDELSEYFLAWYDKRLPKLFPQWYADSKREQAVRGADVSFRQAMVEVYSNLTRYMPDNGKQVVMFTHQDPEIWADLALIMWAAGLEVTAAWTISTETTGGLKAGNYVTGTVCLVLEKRSSEEEEMLDNRFKRKVASRVEKSLDGMRALASSGVNTYNESDYLLAAYAAAMQVCTQFKSLTTRDGDLSAEEHLFKDRPKTGWQHPLLPALEQAVQTAMDYVVPTKFMPSASKQDKLEGWKQLAKVERFYLKALELESREVFQQSALQEYARGFLIPDFASLLAQSSANKARVFSPMELAGRRGNGEFEDTWVHRCLTAVYEVARKGATTEGAQIGLDLLKGKAEFWQHQEFLVSVLTYLVDLRLPTWAEEQDALVLMRDVVKHATYKGV